jgi:hypothetical protein
MSDTAKHYVVQTSNGSTRKYPNVMWFPRSKTDPQEIREVLKIALNVQEASDESFFTDRTLGLEMVRVGMVNVVGMSPDEYIAAYKDKDIGDQSYVTNARMLMRVLRFYGLVTRYSAGKYRVTDLGKVYTQFAGVFPSVTDTESEEDMLSYSLANFSFYAVNDDPRHRDSNFRVRTFLWLLKNLDIEPQCIYQLIVTSFASKSESNEELRRISSLLNSLRNGSSDLTKEFKNLGLDANDYSCVHNFYDSAKILVYLGVKLGLITKHSNAAYGRKISGSGRHLKQASTFYELTDKGKEFLEKYIDDRLVYFSQICELFDEEQAFQAAFLLATLNFRRGSVSVTSIATDYLKGKVDNLEHVLNSFRDQLQIDVEVVSDRLYLRSEIAFNFWQSIPPEVLSSQFFKKLYEGLIMDIANGNNKIELATEKIVVPVPVGEPRYILNEKTFNTPKFDTEEDAKEYVSYVGFDAIYGGQDRFASRVSPTHTLTAVGKEVIVDNQRDALDLIAAIRHSDEETSKFIQANLFELIDNFITKSDTWEKDQHYTWVRNAFRLLGAEAIYSGSSGMLQRSDVSVSKPFIAGIEAKSPREGRGTLNTKAIRQANEAKMQVAAKHRESKGLETTALAIGRRSSPEAIRTQKLFEDAGQPVLLVLDHFLYYLTLKAATIRFDEEFLHDIFTKRAGLLTKSTLSEVFARNLKRLGYDQEAIELSLTEIKRLA